MQSTPLWRLRASSAAVFRRSWCFPDPIAALQKMASLLSPSGVLAFEVGTLGGIRSFWYHWIGCLGYPDHRWFYSEQSLRTLLAMAGFQIESIRHFGLAPAVALYRSRVIAGRVFRAVRPPRTSTVAAPHAMLKEPSR
ncbi:MAG: methyltransferase domain-containing protein [Acidobacteria bacterium]|nr:methyltransferase domain-containing protein [Acidobacteriota bacterium]